MSIRIDGIEQRSGGHAPLADINVTPFVDVMLVLFVIFLVMAPLMTRSIHVELPGGGETIQKSARTEVVVTVQAHGEIDIDGVAVPPDQLETRFASIARKHPDVAVSLHADARDAFGVVAHVLSEVRQAGMTHVSIATVPEKNASM